LTPAPVAIRLKSSCIDAASYGWGHEFISTRHGWIDCMDCNSLFSNRPRQTLPILPQGDPGLFSFSAIASVSNSIADLSARARHSACCSDSRFKTGRRWWSSFYKSKWASALSYRRLGLMSSRDSGLAGDFVEKSCRRWKLNANSLVINDSAALTSTLPIEASA